jgi:hypothetical protein
LFGRNNKTTKGQFRHTETTLQQTLDTLTIFPPLSTLYYIDACGGLRQGSH